MALQTCEVMLSACININDRIARKQLTKAGTCILSQKLSVSSFKACVHGLRVACRHVDPQLLMYHF